MGKINADAAWLKKRAIFHFVHYSNHDLEMKPSNNRGIATINEPKAQHYVLGFLSNIFTGAEGVFE